MNLKEELIRARGMLKAGPEKVRQLAKEATYAAIRAAAEATPPEEDNLRGVNTRTGQLKSHWAEDSITDPVYKNGTWETYLKNNQYYASYVNDGHRMDKHFVPGLYKNPYSGYLEYDATLRDEVGIMVGVKTQYVKGRFMAERGEEAYKDAVDAGLKALAKEITGE